MTEATTTLTRAARPPGCRAVGGAGHSVPRYPVLSRTRKSDKWLIYLDSLATHGHMRTYEWWIGVYRTVVYKPHSS